MDTSNWTIQAMYTKVITMQARNLMNHSNLVCAFSFLNLRGYKTWQEHQLFEELGENLSLKKYMINHQRRLFKEEGGFTNELIPADLYKMDRMGISRNDKQSLVKNLFEKWKGWEEEAKELYAACVQWCIDKQLADSEKFKCLMRDTDKELKEIDNHILKLKDLDYSLLEIIMLQDELCEKYSIRKGDKEEEDTLRVLFFFIPTL